MKLADFPDYDAGLKLDTPLLTLLEQIEVFLEVFFRVLERLKLLSGNVPLSSVFVSIAAEVGSSHCGKLLLCLHGGVLGVLERT